MSYTLSDLGWSSHFSAQLTDDEAAHTTPTRITEVHRAVLTGLSETGNTTVLLPPDTSIAAIAVGDWVLINADGRLVRRLERKSLLRRRAAGTDRADQLIAANLETLFIVTSCNADFNEARLERYLVLAHEAEIQPVIVLTKADETDDADDYARRARGLAANLPVLVFDARVAGEVSALFDWWQPGQSAALVGSSGVGKTTLTNTLTGNSAATAEVREADAHGRHTTTARSLHRAVHGGWLVDTPGMRALRIHSASAGIEAVFGDITDLVGDCKFRDCRHEGEPGCAIQAAVDAGTLDPERLRRWRKLDREEERNSANLAEARAKDRKFGKMVNRAVSAKKSRRKF